ncbi:putative ribosome-binding factor A, mitochondrial isoform X2 [Bombyx mandarina]|uniref:Ribosome-binding factor A, mitochondrial isoform X2 n=1 Tax=Bombyx mandarina TaxID=7092 RepID=A0A6J2JIJ5_BOMMA|nr:putative ribosome-binding factor A, mitochondrial isoform X2 [Bombyx mandarina]
MLSFSRLYHVSSVTCSIKKQSLKLCKMVNPKPKKHWYAPSMLEFNKMPSVKSLTKVTHEPGKRGIRRVAMLNKMFMKHITDLMSTGTVSMDIIGRGIEISKVNVTSDFQTVHVYWICKGTSTDVETEATLNSVAGALRHELSVLRIMGQVPYIVFVKDMHEARILDLDNRLLKADFGENYTPTDPGHLLKTEFTLDTKISPDIKAKIRQLEIEEPSQESPIPEMTHTIYGLDHAKIMMRLLAARKKSKDAWSNLESESPVISYRIHESTPIKVDTVTQNKELAEFLLKRQILQNKLAKQLRKTSDDWQLSDDSGSNSDDEYIDDTYYEDEEYYYDDIEENKKHFAKE